MFDFIAGFFKRTKIEPWEMELLQHVIKQLPAEYKKLQKPIDEGLYRSLLVGLSDIPGYVGFTYNFGLIKKFENRKEPNYSISNLRIWDCVSNQFLKYTIYVAGGHIIGYAITGAKKFKIDISKTDVSSFKKVLFVNKDYEEIKRYLLPTEKKLIDSTEVYKILLDGKRYFHLRDLEDGDFIGIDMDKNIFKIAHDPFKVTLLAGKLVDVLSNSQDFA